MSFFQRIPSEIVTPVMEKYPVKIASGVELVLVSSALSNAWQRELDRGCFSHGCISARLSSLERRSQVRRFARTTYSIDVRVPDMVYATELFAPAIPSTHETTLNRCLSLNHEKDNIP